MAGSKDETKPFQCKYPGCESPGCSSKGAFQRHMKVHGESQGQLYCNYCDYNNYRRDKVAAHVKKHHSSPVNTNNDRNQSLIENQGDDYTDNQTYRDEPQVQHGGFNYGERDTQQHESHYVGTDEPQMGASNSAYSITRPPFNASQYLTTSSQYSPGNISSSAYQIPFTNGQQSNDMTAYDYPDPDNMGAQSQQNMAYYSEAGNDVPDSQNPSYTPDDTK